MRFQRQQCYTPGSILLDETITYIIHADITVRFGFCNVLARTPGSPRACATLCDIVSSRLSADFLRDMISYRCKYYLATLARLEFMRLICSVPVAFVFQVCTLLSTVFNSDHVITKLQIFIIRTSNETGRARVMNTTCGY